MAAGVNLKSHLAKPLRAKARTHLNAPKSYLGPSRIEFCRELVQQFQSLATLAEQEQACAF